MCIGGLLELRKGEMANLMQTHPGTHQTKLSSIILGYKKKHMTELENVHLFLNLEWLFAAVLISRINSWESWFIF
jgi:hypothetical protein